MENFLTRTATRPRVSIVKNGLKVYLEQLLGEDPNKADVARRCDLPYHVIVDIFRGKVQRPDPDILERLSAGLDAPYNDLALAAYGRLVKRPDPITAASHA